MFKCKKMMAHFINYPAKSNEPRKANEPVGPRKLSEPDFVLVIFPDVLVSYDFLVAYLKEVKFLVFLAFLEAPVPRNF